MQKQKKNLKIKIRKRYRYLFRNSNTCLNPLMYSVPRYVLYRINVRITQNNIFCSLISTRGNKFIVNTSAGKEKIKTSRKLLTFSGKNIFQSFLKKIKKKLKIRSILINIIAPLRLKILFLRTLKRFIKKKVLILNISHKKCFNGCRVAKKKRKKQRGLRVYK